MKKKQEYILISDITKRTPYSSEYLSLLVRKNRIKGKKFGRLWYISKTDLKRYMNDQKVEFLKSKKAVAVLAQNDLTEELKKLGWKVGQAKPHLPGLRINKTDTIIDANKQIDADDTNGQINSKFQTRLPDRQVPNYKQIQNTNDQINTYDKGISNDHITSSNDSVSTNLLRNKATNGQEVLEDKKISSEQKISDLETISPKKFYISENEGIKF
jgi:hypothetical protein